MDAFQHCEQLVRAADKDRYLATLFAPADRRGGLFALYAFGAEIAGVRGRVREPMAGEIRLQWWRDALSGERGGEVAANPVAEALMQTVARFALPRQRLLDLIEAHAFDLYDDPMPDFDTLEGYARQTSGVAFELAALICGARAEHAAGQAGIAYGITSLLRIFALHVSRRQLFIPEQAFEEGAPPETAFAGKGSPSLTHALGMMRARARRSLEVAESALSHVPATAMPAFLPLTLVPGYLTAMERPSYDPFRTAVEVPQWRRQWALWRAARRYSALMRG